MLLTPHEQRACAVIVLYCMNFGEGITCRKWLEARDVILKARFCEQCYKLIIIQFSFN